MLDSGALREAVGALGLPVTEVAGAVNDALREHSSLVVTAPPGAGKSTVLPLTILDGLDSIVPDSPGKVLMLEPRRLAARQIAARMASIIGEPIGGTIGYRVRFDTKVSSRTRVEVLTEGILTRMLVADPTMDGVSVLIFDEFHERSLASDLSLALALECQKVLRPDLKIVIMSATIDTDEICSALKAPLVESKGRMFPVEVVHSRTEATLDSIPETVAAAIRIAHRDDEGDILAFLPGEGEIRRCQELLGSSLGSTAVLPLFGNLSIEEQHRAIAPSREGERKVVLATPIAETSLTIEGVRVVIDSGFHRRMLYDVRNALERLSTLRISLDMAGQRAGRAGRVAPGKCYRLWSLATEKTMAPTRGPEMLDADLCSLVLDVAAWGESDVSRLPWLTKPSAAAVAEARSLLTMLGALDSSGRITSHGRLLSGLPCHPRIASMLVRAETASERSLACDIAALLEEKDPMSLEINGSDISLRVSGLRRSGRGEGSTKVWGRISRIARQYREMVRAGEDLSDPDPYSAGALLAAAYPERVAREMPESCGRYMLATGETVSLDHSDPVSSSPWIAVASLNVRQGKDGRAFLASPLDPKDVRRLASEYVNVSWDQKKGAAVAQTELRLGRLVLEAKPVGEGMRERIVDAICEACRKDGASILDFSDEVGNLQRRVAAVASWHPELELPDLSSDAVLARVHEWLPLYIGKASTRAELKKLDLVQMLWGLLSYGQQNEVERLAPSHIQVPTGSRIRVDYRLGADAPVLRVRLQECFGLADTPCVDGGRRPVLMELLSPGFKPVQLTSDLRSFWNGTYFEVRKELKRRYPKHSWPDNPLEADAVRGVKR